MLVVVPLLRVPGSAAVLAHTSWGHLPSLPLINKRANAAQGSARDAADPHVCTPIRPTTDVLARYKTMHETLVYLSHLDHDDTEHQMLDKLRLQVSRCTQDFVCKGLCTRVVCMCCLMARAG